MQLLFWPDQFVHLDNWLLLEFFGAQELKVFTDELLTFFRDHLIVEYFECSMLILFELLVKNANDLTWSENSKLILVLVTAADHFNPMKENHVEQANRARVLEPALHKLNKQRVLSFEFCLVLCTV